MVVTPEFVETLAQGVWAKRPAPAETLDQVVQRVSALLTPAASNLEAVVTPEAIQRALVIHWIKEVLDDPEVCAALREQVEIPWEVLERINPNAAGLDIGAEEIWACVPEGRDENHVQMFPTFTVDLNRLADWLEKCKIDTVAMESTGVYWIPVYELLESRGFKVYLVNARHIKNVPGKKTDVLDCQPAWRQTGGSSNYIPMGCFKLPSGQKRTCARCAPMIGYANHGIGITGCAIARRIFSTCTRHWRR
jgi:hypothetical protein